MKNKLAVMAALSAMLVLLLASGQVILQCQAALRLCLELIMPSLFPFFVVSALLSRLGFPAYAGRLLAPAASRLFGVSGRGISAFFVGICGGYPMGAAYIEQLYSEGYIGSEEAARLLVFCNNSGPAFIIGAVGAGVFGSAAAGFFLYGVHIAAALLTGIIMRKKTPIGEGDIPSVKTRSFIECFPEAVRQAVISVLNVCGFVVVFTVFTGLLSAAGLIPLLCGWLSSVTGIEIRALRAGITGLMELGSAVGAMQGLSLNPKNLSLAAAILGWGGISVHFQTLALISDSNIKSAPHFVGRILSSVLGAAIALAGGLIFFS